MRVFSKYGISDRNGGLVVVRQFPCVSLYPSTVVVCEHNRHQRSAYIKIRRADVDSDNAFHVINDPKLFGMSREISS